MRLSKAHKQVDMMKKTPSEFKNHEDWLAYVREEMPIKDQPFALAFGRMEIFRNLYRVRQLEFPRQFLAELNRIEMLDDPERTATLEALNEVVFRSVTRHLFDRAQTARSADETQRVASPRELIGQLLNHLAQKNPYFALWLVYNRGESDGSIVQEWDDYLIQELCAESGDEVEFTHAMRELDRILTLFRDRNQALPSLVFERIWFLHHLHGPERMAQTRAVLGMLTAELAPCTSA